MSNLFYIKSEAIHVPVKPLSLSLVVNSELVFTLSSVSVVISFVLPVKKSSESLTPLIAAALRAILSASLFCPFRHNHGSDSGKILRVDYSWNLDLKRDVRIHYKI